MFLATLRAMPSQSLAALSQAFSDGATPLETRRLLALAIAAAGGTAAFDVLWPVYVLSEDYLLRNGILQGLRSAGGATVTTGICRNIDRELRSVSRRLRKVIRMYNHCAAGDFLTMILADRICMLCREIFSLLYVRDRNAEILRVEANLFSPDHRCRENALELLEQLLHGAVQKDVLRALDDWLVAAPAAGVSTRATHDQVLTCDPWLRTAAIYSLCQRGDINPEKDVVMNTHEQQLFDTVRTISFLKRIELFREIPAELLAGLADICHERMFADGAVIFTKLIPETPCI